MYPDSPRVWPISSAVPAVALEIKSECQWAGGGSGLAILFGAMLIIIKQLLIKMAFKKLKLVQ